MYRNTIYFFIIPQNFKVCVSTSESRIIISKKYFLNFKACGPLRPATENPKLIAVLERKQKIKILGNEVCGLLSPDKAGLQRVTDF